MPQSPRVWWEELLDTLQGDSRSALRLNPASFCLRDFSGHRIGMIIVHVDDMLLATNGSHQAESHISRLLITYEITHAKRADSDVGVLFCGQRIRTVPDDVKIGGVALRQDRTESVRTRCEPASRSRTRDRQEEGHGTDEPFATSQLQRKPSAPLVSDHRRAVHTVKRLRGQPEIGLRFRPQPTKMCVLVCTDSARHNAEADREGSDDERLAQ